MSLLGSLLAYEGDFGVTLGSLWGTSASLLACEGDFGVTLESLFAYDGDFVATLGAFGGHYWHLRVALRVLWCYFRRTCGIWGCLLGHFEVILGSVWGQFGYLWVTLGHLMVTLQ